jgi:polyhydroxybutyrate depolymerase
LIQLEFKAKFHHKAGRTTEVQKKSAFTIIIVGILIFSGYQPLNGQWLKEKIGNFLIKRIREKNKKFPIQSKRFSLTHNDRERTYYVYKPSVSDENKKLPVVLLFHGGGGNARNAIHYYELEETAEKYDFLLVAPDGTGKAKDVLLTWNVEFGFGYANENNVDDYGFINKLLQKIEKDYKIDENRIYATGLSNGAIFCHFLAAQPENRIAAIAPVVGTAGGKKINGDKIIMPPKPEKPVSVCIIQGVIDKHVPVNGGKQIESINEPRYMISASDTIRFWLKANNIEKPPKTTHDKKLKASIHKYSDGSNNTSVVAYLVHNLGHAWPGSKEKPYRRADKPPPQFPANEIIWKFFSSHPRKTD